MTNYKDIIINNRTNTTALKANSFETIEQFQNWKSSVEALRLSVSNYAVANRNNADDETVKACINKVFDAYKVVLSVFTNKSLDQKLRCQSQDSETLLTFIGSNRRIKDSDNGKQFIPASATTFRKSVEDFISDRFTGSLSVTAETIEAEKIAKREAKKAEAKAAREAEKAVKLEATEAPKKPRNSKKAEKPTETVVAAG